MAQGRTGRLAPLINGAVAAGLVALLAVAALVVNPPAPPGIAEFAPRADKPISKAPQGQTLGSTPGNGECVGALCAAGTPTPKPVASQVAPGQVGRSKGVPSSLQCYEWPDGSVTQTFDPQSPPCVATWPDADKGNGGATSFGVDKGTIRISLGAELSRTSPQTNVISETQIAHDFAEFFNRHFQLYGRKIVLVSHRVGTGGTDPSSQRAAAAKAKEQRAFASIFGIANGNPVPEVGANDNSVFLETLARNRILGVNALPTYTTSQELDRSAPYLWSYFPTFDQQQRNAAEFLCKAIVGQPAEFAGDVPLRTQKRSFVLLYPKLTNGKAPDVAPVREGLSACGVQVETQEFVGYNAPSNAPDTSNDSALLELKNRGITTLLTVGSINDRKKLMDGAARVSYRPEWFALSSSNFSVDGYVTVQPDVRATMFGIAPWNKSLPLNESIAFRAFQETDGGRTDLQWFGYNAELLYKALLLLASGIQAAGPDLTPQTFEAALQRLQFPNPEKGGPTHYQGTVGFADDHTMVDDFGLWFYKNGEPAYDGAIANKNGAGGNYCYVGRGTRFRLGSWPEDDAGLFAPNARC